MGTAPKTVATTGPKPTVTMTAAATTITTAVKYQRSTLTVQTAAAKAEGKSNVRARGLANKVCYMSSARWT